MDKQNEKARENELMELTPDQMDKVSGGVKLEVTDQNYQASTQRRESRSDEFETVL